VTWALIIADLAGATASRSRASRLNRRHARADAGLARAVMGPLPSRATNSTHTGDIPAAARRFTTF
jgi:hypothetical protein